MINRSIFILLISVSVIYTQNRVKINVMDSSTSKPIYGLRASILNTNLRTGSDSTGLVIFESVPDGYYTFHFSYVGYNQYTINLEISSKEENFFTLKYLNLNIMERLLIYEFFNRV